MGAEFTPVFLFILVAILTAIGMLTASAVLGPKQRTAVKQMPYESGMDPIGDARQRFDVRYYLVAIMFLLFDVELLYLYPWAVAQWSVDGPAVTALDRGGNEIPYPADPDKIDKFRWNIPDTNGWLRTNADYMKMSQPGVGIPPAFRGLVFWEILVFIAVLAAAYAYAWKKGVFTWR